MKQTYVPSITSSLFKIWFSQWLLLIFIFKKIKKLLVALLYSVSEIEQSYYFHIFVAIYFLNKNINVLASWSVSDYLLAGLSWLKTVCSTKENSTTFLVSVLVDVTRNNCFHSVISWPDFPFFDRFLVLFFKPLSPFFSYKENELLTIGTA